MNNICVWSFLPWKLTGNYFLHTICMTNQWFSKWKEKNPNSMELIAHKIEGAQTNFWGSNSANSFNEWYFCITFLFDWNEFNLNSLKLAESQHWFIEISAAKSIFTHFHKMCKRRKKNKFLLVWKVLILYSCDGPLIIVNTMACEGRNCSNPSIFHVCDRYQWKLYCLVNWLLRINLNWLNVWKTNHRPRATHDEWQRAKRVKDKERRISTQL